MLHIGIQEIPAKTIVTRSQHTQDWFGCDYNMNIYKGCCHGCIYCDSRSECYGVDHFDEVRCKQDALVIIERELKGKRKTGVVGTGAMSDPYNPYEATRKLTRGALTCIDRYGFGISTMTKSALITRDIDVYKRIAAHSPVCVMLTVTTADDALCSKIEPHVSLSSVRFAAVKELSEAGLFAGVLLMPLLPFINDTEENVSAIVVEAAKAGARFIYPAFGVTLRQNQRVHFYEQIDRLFPGTKQKYMETFGDSYNCTSPNVKALHSAFVSLCRQFGLAYKMDGIIAAYKESYGQATLF